MNNEEEDSCNVLVDAKVTQTESTWKKKLIPHVNVEMLPTKITYLLWGGLVGSYHIYLLPFFISIGLSVSQAGIITGMISVSYSFAGPFWGMVTDYTGRRKTILIILSLVSMATILSLPWVAATLQYSPQPKLRDQNENFTNRVGSKRNESKKFDSANEITSSLFEVYFLLITLGSVFFATLPGYIDAIGSHVAKTSKRKASYGSQRIFGSIGSCVAVYLSGVAVDSFRMDGMSDYSIAFMAYVPFALLMIPMGCYLIKQTEEYENEVEHENEDNNNVMGVNQSNHVDKSILVLLSEMFQKLEVILFLLTALVSGLAFSLFLYFTILLLDNETDISKSKMGLIFSIASASSVVMFPFTAKIIKLLRGPLPAIYLGIFSYCIRFMIMSYVTNYWLIASIQSLNSVGFALLWSAMMEHIHVISPPKIKVTMILVLQSIHFGIAPFTTNIICGKLFDLYGGKVLFRFAGIICGIWGVIFLIRFYGRKYLTYKKEYNVNEAELKNSLI